VGRSLGISVAQQLSQRADWPSLIQPHEVGAIVQSACLAHDIGTPPFGHFGENAIRDWFVKYAAAGGLVALSSAEQADLIGFEGNAQGLRTLTRLEYHQFKGGMRLTYATLGSFLKYPWLATNPISKQKGKFGCLLAEQAILHDIALRLGLKLLGDYHWCRHPLVYLMEAADDICYAIIDLEDGVELGILDEIDVLALLAPITERLQLPAMARATHQYQATRRLALVRGKVIDYLVSACTHAFIEQERALLSGTLPDDLISHADAVTRQVIGNAKSLARERIFNNPQRHRMELGACTVLAKLLDGFIPAAMEASAYEQEDAMSLRTQKYLALMGTYRPNVGARPYRAICQTMDFIAGMTDNYAVTLSRQFSGELG
jgi:dGTPase